MSEQPYLDPQALSETVAAVRANPDLGRVTFSLESTSHGGLRMLSRTGALTQAGQRNEIRQGKFTLSSDEPASLLGSDQAVSPAEYILKGLAGCYGVTLVSCAAARGIQLQRIDLELEFDINLGGFLGVDKSVRMGAEEIKVKVRLESPGVSRSELLDLIGELERTSPIRDTLANPVRVTTQLAD